MTESTTLLVSDWRMSRFLEAPYARRTAVCVRLADPRASSRLAILAQAISKTRKQTAKRIR
jgi:hypothetical protein